MSPLNTKNIIYLFYAQIIFYASLIGPAVPKGVN